MRDSDYSRLIIGYHGTDESIVQRVLSHGENLDVSNNDYDWLGRGIYFWEYGPERALEWAKDYSKIKPSRIKKPAVLGAYIHLGNCFDLMDTRYTKMLADVFPAFCTFCKEKGTSIPKNENHPKSAPEDLIMRYLDCAMLNWLLDTLEIHEQKYDTVRSAFVEGKEAFPGSKLRAKSHIQVVVRNPSRIVGYFRPKLT